MARPSETWRHLPTFRHYQVSDLGRIRNCSTGKTLAGERDRYGYRRVNLVTDDGRKVKRSVHRLVCEAFHGTPPSALDAAHLNGVRHDNRAANLMWATRGENNSHKALHGTQQKGERHPRAKLSGEQVATIRTSTLPHRALARVMGVVEGTIRKIRKGDRWNG